MKSSTTAQLLEATARAVYDQRGPKAIHPGQWAVLRFLAEAESSNRTVGGVAAALGVTHAPASRAISALQRKRLVDVKVSEADRRVRELRLTARAEELLKDDPIRRLTAAIEALDRSQALTLEGVLRTILLHLPGGKNGGSCGQSAP